MLTLSPLPGHLLVEPQAVTGSILEADFALPVEGLTTGRVTAVGPEVRDLKVDDLVMFRTHAANGFKVDEQGHLSVPAAEVVMVLEPR